MERELLGGWEQGRGRRTVLILGQTKHESNQLGMTRPSACLGDGFSNEEDVTYELLLMVWEY